MHYLLINLNSGYEQSISPKVILSHVQSQSPAGLIGQQSKQQSPETENPKLFNTRMHQF